MLEAAQRATGLTPNRARALLGRFLFCGEQAEKPLAGLSGGERRRLSLAMLVSGGANVLILDEPTNHLDLESREALEDALRAFQGALLLVSHDRALLDAVGTRTVAVEDGALHSYVGGWPEYVRVREERRAAGEALMGATRRSARARARREARPARTAQRRRGRARDGGAHGDAGLAGPLGRSPGRRGPGPNPRDPPRTGCATSSGPSARSRRPRLRSRRSRTSSPTRRRGRRKYEAAKNEARHTAAQACGRGRLRAPRSAGGA